MFISNIIIEDEQSFKLTSTTSRLVLAHPLSFLHHHHLCPRHPTLPSTTTTIWLWAPPLHWGMWAQKWHLNSPQKRGHTYTCPVPFQILPPMSLTPQIHPNHVQQHGHKPLPSSGGCGLNQHHLSSLRSEVGPWGGSMMRKKGESRRREKLIVMKWEKQWGGNWGGEIDEEGWIDNKEEKGKSRGGNEWQMSWPVSPFPLFPQPILMMLNPTGSPLWCGQAG